MLSLLAATACGGEEDILDAYFIDEVVGAPARTTEISVFDGTTCEDLLSTPADAVQEAGSRIATRTAGFPINPDARVLDGLPRGKNLVFHVTARDGDGLVVGRGCVIQELAPKGPLDVSVELHALPKCETEARFLDVAIVLDTSLLAILYPGNEHLDLLESDLVMQMEQGTRFSIITHGHTLPPSEHLAPTSDKETAIEALDTLRGKTGERVELFNGVTLATRLLRSRAICGRRPAVLVVEAGQDGSESNIPVIEAQIGLYATSGDSADDIFVFGVYATEGAQADLVELTDGLTSADLAPGSTVPVFRQALLDAKFGFDALIVR